MRRPAKRTLFLSRPYLQPKSHQHRCAYADGFSAVMLQLRHCSTIAPKSRNPQLQLPACFWSATWLGCSFRLSMRPQMLASPRDNGCMMAHGRLSCHEYCHSEEKAWAVHWTTQIAPSPSGKRCVLCIMPRAARVWSPSCALGRYFQGQRR